VVVEDPPAFVSAVVVFAAVVARAASLRSSDAHPAATAATESATTEATIAATCRWCRRRRDMFADVRACGGVAA